MHCNSKQCKLCSFCDKQSVFKYLILIEYLFIRCNSIILINIVLVLNYAFLFEKHISRSRVKILA